MLRIKRKMLSGVIFMIVLFCANIPYSVQAASMTVMMHETMSDDNDIIPFADVIVYKYRKVGNKMQYRRWNETKGRWVDPYWIDMP